MDNQPVKFLYLGDSALQIQLEQEISLSVSRKICRLQEAIETGRLPGIREFVPTYCTLTVHYDPDRISYSELKALLEDRMRETDLTEASGTGESEEVMEIPVLYGGELGPDLAAAAELQGVSTEEFISMHTRNLSYVYCLGFSPGHPCSARSRDPFKVKRKLTPVPSIPARSVVVIEDRTDLIPYEQPTGWHVIGSTPLLISDMRRKEPFLIRAGQWLRFVRIDEREYQRLLKLCDEGSYTPRCYPKESET